MSWGGPQNTALALRADELTPTIRPRVRSMSAGGGQFCQSKEVIRPDRQIPGRRRPLLVGGRRADPAPSFRGGLALEIPRGGWTFPSSPCLERAGATRQENCFAQNFRPREHRAKGRPAFGFDRHRNMPSPILRGLKSAGAKGREQMMAHRRFQRIGDALDAYID